MFELDTFTLWGLTKRISRTFEFLCVDGLEYANDLAAFVLPQHHGGLAVIIALGKLHSGGPCVGLVVDVGS